MKISILTTVAALLLSPAIAVAQERPLAGEERVIILFDQSGSMDKPLDGVPKIEIAKTFFQELGEQIRGRDNVAVRFFAQDRGDLADACEAGQLVLPFGAPVDQSALRRIQDRVEAAGSRTNIEYALRAARQELQAAGGGRIILISDGLENCEGDPAAFAQSMPDQAIDVVALGDAGDLAPLSGIALAGDGGAFHVADSAGAFSAAMGMALPGLDFGDLPDMPDMPDADALTQEIEVETGVAQCPAFDDLAQQLVDYVRGSVAMTSEIVAGEGEPPVAIEFILDASGSMAGRVDGEVKMAIARAALEAALLELHGAPVLMGLRAYGFNNQVEKTAEASCPNTELLSDFVLGESSSLLAEAQGLTPYGYTPIAASLRAAAEDLLKLESRERLMVLISDGEETCFGDPVATAAELAEQDVGLSTFVIGFDLEEDQAEQMRAVAEAGGGRYLDAPDAAGLTETLREVVGVTVNKVERRMPRCENALPGGKTPETAVLITPGMYTIGELLERGEYRYYQVMTKEGELGSVRGLIQSWRYTDGDAGPEESTSGLGALTVRILNADGEEAGTRPGRERDLPGTSMVAQFADTQGRGFILGIGDNYDRSNPDSLFEVTIEDARDAGVGDAPGSREAGDPMPLITGEATEGHIGHDDEIDVWRAQVSGASELTIRFTDLPMNVELAVYDAETGRRLARGKEQLRFEHVGVVLIQLRSREPRLASKFSRYELQLN